MTTQTTESPPFDINLKVLTINLRNLALPNFVYYSGSPAYSEAEYQAKIAWTANWIDRVHADVVVFQEVFHEKALKDVLALTKRLNAPHLIARDAQATDHGGLTPQVAIASRYPFVDEPQWVDLNAPNLEINLPNSDLKINKMTRACLHVQLRLPNDRSLHVIGLHLKSKRPELMGSEDAGNPDDVAIGTLRSLMRRGTDALAVRRFLNDLITRNHQPCIVVGDFNDGEESVTTQMIAGQGRFGKSAMDYQLKSALRCQTQFDPTKNVSYSYIHSGQYMTLDHVLVSEEFWPESKYQTAQVVRVSFFNDHIQFKEPFTSDHGLVVAELSFRNASKVSF